MIHVERVGTRALLLRPISPMDVTDMPTTEAAVRKFIAGSKEPPVMVVDLRRAAVLDARKAKAVLETMITSPTLSVAREALLVAANAATLAMQFERLIREAGSTNRRVFSSRDLLLEWVDEVLNPSDRGALRAHLPAVLKS